MRRWVGLAGLATLGAVAAGCMSGGSPHGTLSASDALAQARKDGFLKPARVSRPPVYECSRHRFERAVTSSGRFSEYRRPSYALVFTDRHVPVTFDTVRVAMLITVFPDAATAARCARAGIFQAMHIPTNSSSRLIDPTTVLSVMHAPNAPGFEVPDDTGQYNTFIAHSRVFAQGLAYNEPHSKIVRQDLERLAAEIAG